MSKIFNYDSGAKAGNVLANISPNSVVPALRWKIHRFRATLTCDATVANRIIRIRFYDDTGVSNEISSPISSGNVVAGETKQFSGNTISVGAGSTIADYAYIALSAPIVIDKAQSMSVEIINGVAGDSHRIRAVIEEEPSGS